jgi:hypothetical protein
LFRRNQLCGIRIGHHHHRRHQNQVNALQTKTSAYCVVVVVVL